jgi:hypothetical protein
MSRSGEVRQHKMKLFLPILIWLHTLLAFWSRHCHGYATGLLPSSLGWLFPVTGIWLRRLVVSLLVTLFVVWSLVFYPTLVAPQRY